MADNVAVTQGSGTTFAADDISSVFYPRAKLSLGADGVAVDAGAGAGVVGTDTQRVTLGSDDPAVATLGAVADAAATAGSTGSLSAKLRLMTTQLNTLAGTNSQFPATPSSFPITTITRPANTTAYTANDVLGGAITIATGLTSGQNGAIIYAYLLPQITAVPSGMTSFRLYLYDVTPASAIADNSAFTWTSTDWGAFLGYIDFPTPVDLGSGLLSQVAVPNQPIKLNGSANIFGYLVTNGGFTPANNSEVYTLRIGFVGI